MKNANMLKNISTKDLNPQRIKEHTYDDPINGRKVQRGIEMNGLADINEMIEKYVLCPTNYVDENGQKVFEGVQTCIRELSDLIDVVTDGTDPEKANRIHARAEKIKARVNERLLAKQRLETLPTES